MNRQVTIKALPNLTAYDAPQHFGEELACYATADDIVLGVVVRNTEGDDPPGHDFAWAALTQKPPGETVDDIATELAQDPPAGTYRMYHYQPWYRTVEEATADLHAEMRQAHEREVRYAIWQARLERLGPVNPDDPDEWEEVERFGDEPEPDVVDVENAWRRLTEQVAAGKTGAKRRKAAGSSTADVVVEPGAIGVMLDVLGAGSSMMAIPANDLENKLAEIGTRAAASGNKPQPESLEWHSDEREAIADIMQKAVEAKDRRATETCMMWALWLLFNYPTRPTGGLRRSLSRELREQGRAYITIALDLEGCMVHAVGSRFVHQLRDTLVKITTQGVPEDLDYVEFEQPHNASPMH